MMQQQSEYEHPIGQEPKRITSITFNSETYLFFALVILLVLVVVLSIILTRSSQQETQTIPVNVTVPQAPMPQTVQHEDTILTPSSAGVLSDQRPLREPTPAPSAEAERYYVQAIEYQDVSYCHEIKESVTYAHDCITAVAILNRSQPDCYDLPYGSNDWNACLFDMYVMAARDANNPSLCVNVPDKDEATCRRLAADTSYRPLDALLPQGITGIGDAKIVDCLPFRDQASCTATTPWDRSSLYCVSKEWDVYEPRGIYYNGELQVFFFRVTDFDQRRGQTKVSLMRYTKVRGVEEIDQLAYTEGYGHYFIEDVNLALTEDGKLYYFNDPADSDAYRIFALTPGPIEVDMYDVTTGEISRNVTHYFGPRDSVRSYDGRYDLIANPGHHAFGEAVGLALYDHATGATTTIIGQPYDGEWSVGRTSWNFTGDKIYFDNSGPVACIWEYDLTTHELRKIVPEHNAVDVSYVGAPTQEDQLDDAVVYLEDDCIMFATRPAPLN